MIGLIALWSLVLAIINFIIFYWAMNCGYKKDTDRVYILAICCFILSALCLLFSGITGLIWLVVLLI